MANSIHYEVYYYMKHLNLRYHNDDTGKKYSISRESGPNTNKQDSVEKHQNYVLIMEGCF